MLTLLHGVRFEIEILYHRINCTNYLHKCRDDCRELGKNCCIWKSPVGSLIVPSKLIFNLRSGRMNYKEDGARRGYEPEVYSQIFEKEEAEKKAR